MEQHGYGTLANEAVERQPDKIKDDERTYLLEHAQGLDDGRPPAIERKLLSKFARAMWLLGSAATAATLTLLLFSQPAPAAPALDPSLVKDLGFAKFKGSYSAKYNVNQWYGIPYAGTTAGDRRWRAPVPISKSLESLPAAGSDATIDVGAEPGKKGSKAFRCFQGYPQWSTLRWPGDPPESEACLQLSIVVPANATRLPVFVWIHGGGYTLGKADHNMGFPGLKHTGGAFVYVALQYRLGAFGFLSSEEVRRDGTANAGLLDQRLALEFVKEHIGKFGGDPEKVTIAGGSAGGGSVSYQLMLHGGEEKPPFQAALAEFPWWQRLKPDDILETQYRHLKAEAKCETLEQLRGRSALECLRGMKAPELAKAAQATYKLGYDRPNASYGFGDFYYGPSVDNITIKGLPSREFAAGRFSPVPVLASRALWEGKSFSDGKVNTNESFQADLRAMIPKASDEFFARLTKLYPRQDYYEKRAELFGDFFVNCPTAWILSAVAAKKMPAYKLIFKEGDEKHGAESGYVYWEDLPPDPHNIAPDMKDWFFSFAIHSDPNKQTWQKETRKPDWPAYGKTAQALSVTKTLENGSPYRIGVDDDIGPKCDFWRDHADITRN